MDVIDTACLGLFWTCLGLVVYAYAGYPALGSFFAICFGTKRKAPDVPDGSLPYVSLLIAAYNEEGVIEQRIQSALAMDYPKDKLEILIASDGSTDQTTALTRKYEGRGVRLLDYKTRRGKAAVLNASFPELTGQIVLLSDANTDIDPAAVRRLVRWFHWPEVGIVSGRLILTDPKTRRNVDGLYWKYETFLKRCDDRLGGLLGANGAIYAIRKELFSPLSESTILDDFVIPLQAKLKTGCLIVYDKTAVAREETSCNIMAEFHRRSRIGAGGFQSIAMLAPLLNPRHGWVAFTFFSHKVMRWMCPFFLVGALLSNIALCEFPLYRNLLVGQGCFYCLAALMAFMPAHSRVLRLLRLTTMFTSMNAALLVGFVRWLRNAQQATWKRTERVINPESLAALGGEIVGASADLDAPGAALAKRWRLSATHDIADPRLASPSTPLGKE
jgi:cellulose synthase/poly-beta-1,6-N-acetylglucosamine synthase-like glycosyltransferase